MKNSESDIVIVGAGISGLYCSWKLLKKDPNIKITLLERSNRIGGRIESVKLNGFFAEFGPMRFERRQLQFKEIGGQVKFQNLLDELDMNNLNYIDKFVPYSTEIIDLSKYSLTNSERVCTDAKQLMKLGIYRLLENYRITVSKKERYFVYNEIDHINNKTWINNLTEEDFKHMRREAKYVNRRRINKVKENNENNEDFTTFPYTIELYKLGIWNALSYVLSYDAIKVIKDNGNFYHLLNENPNAIEWIIFWLRGFNEKDELYTIKGGVSQIVNKLHNKLLQFKDRFKLIKGVEVSKLEQTESKAKIYFNNSQDSIIANHVILTIPKEPLLKLNDSLTEVHNEIESVFGFPLLKCFYVVENPWWNENTPVHTRASSIPAREIHYSNARNSKSNSNEGMVLLYMDRPYREYWTNYVKDKAVQEKAEIYNSECQRIDNETLLPIPVKDGLPPPAKALKDEFYKYLYSLNQDNGSNKEEMIKIITANTSLSEEDKKNKIEYLEQMVDQNSNMNQRMKVLYYGIRDWGKPPYGAACHSWKPGAQSWKVLEKLKAFSLTNNNENKIFHICGEAYCDYNGFIEGSLRSSDDVLETIMG